MIHQYKNNGYNIVLDVNSGSVHVVDDIVYDIIALYENNSEDKIIEELKDKYAVEDIKEACLEISELKEAGQLFTEDIYEPYIDSFKDRPTVVKALCLHIAHDCNLACKYCFAEEGEYHGRRALMSFELVEYGRSLEKEHNKNFRFTLTTNGILLNDEILDFANKEMGNIVLSIDGRKEINDLMRPTRNNHGSSYDIIMPKFKKVAESRNQMNYYVRGTFTHNNLDFSEDVLHLADEGFEQISVEPVVAQPTDSYAIREEDLPVIFEQYDKLAKEIIKRKKAGNGFNFFHFMIDLSGGPCVAKRLSGCGSGCEYLAVTPWGDFYPCHQFVGNEDFLMGNVDEGITRNDIRDSFKNCNVYSKEKCKNCFAKFYCSGGCAANSYNFHGNINDAYDVGCEMQKKRIECAIMIRAAMAEEN